MQTRRLFSRNKLLQNSQEPTCNEQKFYVSLNNGPINASMMNSPYLGQKNNATPTSPFTNLTYQIKPSSKLSYPAVPYALSVLARSSFIFHYCVSCTSSSESVGLLLAGGCPTWEALVSSGTGTWASFWTILRQERFQWGIIFVYLYKYCFFVDMWELPSSLTLALILSIMATPDGPCGRVILEHHSQRSPDSHSMEWERSPLHQA